MKTLTLLAVAGLLAINLPAQAASQTSSTTSAGQSLPAPTDYRVVDRGANHKVWQRETYEQGPNGEVRTHVHQYTELASGMHYLDANGQWQESQELIEAFPGGAVARQGQYQVIFANNLNSAGAIDVQTSDGKRLRSNILGLMYVDTVTGDAAFIAHLQDSQGELISDNQVLYPNAFQEVSADVRYTYKKGRFEQDVILRGQPPAPSSLGLNPDTTVLEVVTEFINPPAATVTETDQNNPSQSDATVKWGATRIGRGKAFDLSNNQDVSSWAPVKKRYVTISGRKYLIERVPLKNIQPQLSKLPEQASNRSSYPALAKKEVEMPPAPGVKRDDKRMLLAAVAPSDKGYVLDYVTVNSGASNFTFQGDKTYYVTGWGYMSGLTTIEGGTVIKFANNPNNMPMVDLYDAWVCDTDPYRPAVFTSKDDNSVGETISGSTGNPSILTNTYFLALDGVTNNIPAHDLRFSYAQFAFAPAYNPAGAVDVWDCQFYKCQNALDCWHYAPLRLHNVLIAKCTSVGACWVSAVPNFSGENVTADTVNMFDTNTVPATVLSLTNSIIVCTDTNFRSPTIYTNHCAINPTGTLFLTSRGGNYYLTNGSTLRASGTTNINSALLADLSQKTTYPPVVYANQTFSTPTNFSPQAARDTNSSPDLGYHYDPLDYVFGHCQFNTNINFTAGTAVGWYRPSSGWYHNGYGIFINDRQNLYFQGTATAPCWWVRLNTVQEHDTTAGYGPGGLDGEADQYAGDITRSPIVWGNFLKCSILAGEAGSIMRDDYGYIILNAINSEFYSGGLGGYGPSFNLTNCLFYRSGFGNMQGWPGDYVYFQSCTFHGGSITLTTPNSIPIRAINCALEGTATSISGYGANTNNATYDYNAYTNSSNPLVVGGAHDVIVTNRFNWQSGPLGNFYLPSDSPVIDMGSTNANLLGFYHYTTQTNQVKEANSTVDIGYHYVAVDAYDNPIDTNGDGIPDYVEDANGNGLVDNGELGWNWADPKFHVWIIQPRNNSILP